MQKITIKELIEFKRKISEKSKKNFAYKLKHRKEIDKKKVENDGGGDYWVTSTSSIYKAFKYDSKEFYDSKIDELQSKYESTSDLRIKSMYERNINILISFKDFDFDNLRPANIQKFETVHKNQKIITVENYPLYVNPSLLFCYEQNDKKEIGALWLIPQLDGFKKSELGMFCEMLYKFLVKNYSAEYQISEDYCIVVDTHNAQTVIYSELVVGEIPFQVEKTLNEIKSL